MLTCTWQPIASGGVPPYSYQWSGALSGTGISVTGSISSSSALNLTVTDSFQNQKFTSLAITVDEEIEECME